MKHSMRLYEKPFKSIQEGKKIVEVRLNDEKRQKLQIGDMIEFVKIPKTGEMLKVEVIELCRYDTFEEMYQAIPFDLFDCKGSTMEEMINETFEIYTKEQEKQWGTLAIKIGVLN
jgi:ASC-1-like (ASCH) protein